MAAVQPHLQSRPVCQTEVRPVRRHSSRVRRAPGPTSSRMRSEKPLMTAGWSDSDFLDHLAKRNNALGVCHGEAERYIAEFKRQALRRANEPGVTDALVCEELGISAREPRTRIQGNGSLTPEGNCSGSGNWRPKANRRSSMDMRCLRELLRATNHCPDGQIAKKLPRNCPGTTLRWPIPVINLPGRSGRRGEKKSQSA